MCSGNSERTVKVSDVEKKIVHKGFKPEDLMNTLDEYVNLNVIYVNGNKTEVTLL